MGYKTILVHVDEARNIDTRIALAAELALREDAHLVGAASTGVSRYVYQSMVASIDSGVIDGYMDALQERAERALRHFEEVVRRIGVASWEARPAMDEPAGGLSLQARYCDLCVLGQFDPDESAPLVQPNLREYVAIHGGAPVLVVPNRWNRTSPGERCLVAWNASVDAKHALQAAIPMLRAAGSVDIVVFQNGELDELAGEQPGLDVAAFLARHGIPVSLQERRVDGEVGHALLALATEVRADMLVMGCYGHSRFREILLGGATRTVLESMHLPVLMAH
ncbi:MAG TPA: universal stress protein [Noviherbaspirillum sp.]|nr:universal stress protein [Noviherbaspirillum sp.]